MLKIKSFGDFICETHTFLEFREVLNTIGDYSHSLEDLGVDFTFGHMPTALYHPKEPNFDTYIDELVIRRAQLGKSILFARWDFKAVEISQLGEAIGEFRAQFRAIIDYLIWEDVAIWSLWNRKPRQFGRTTVGSEYKLIWSREIKPGEVGSKDSDDLDNFGKVVNDWIWGLSQLEFYQQEDLLHFSITLGFCGRPFGED